jgi:alpha-galactosidase
LPANAGFVFDTFSRGLDTTHPGVQEHTRKLIATAINDWGYPYLKLDFLYAAAIRGKRYDPTRTRAQAMRRGLELIREVAGPTTFLLGCGVPLGSAIGVVDAMRIGPDVNVRWRPKYFLSLPFYNEPGMPAVRNAIRNTLTRAPLHRRWWLNDPDCLLVREGTELTLDEVTSLSSVIALSGGMFVVSDDLTTLSAERRKYITPLLPVIGKSALAHDWLEHELPEWLELPLTGAAGDWKVVGLFNWSERRAGRSLPIDVDSHVFDFWSQTYTRTDRPLSLPNLPPHGGRLLAVRPVRAGAQYVGSSLHFSQGYEITDWQGTERQVKFVINLNRTADGTVTLSLPDASNGVPTLRQPHLPPVPGRRLADGIYQFPVQVSKQAEITVEW